MVDVLRSSSYLEYPLPGSSTTQTGILRSPCAIKKNRARPAFEYPVPMVCSNDLYHFHYPHFVERGEWVTLRWTPGCFRSVGVALCAGIEAAFRRDFSHLLYAANSDRHSNPFTPLVTEGKPESNTLSQLGRRLHGNWRRADEYSSAWKRHRDCFRFNLTKILTDVTAYSYAVPLVGESSSNKSQQGKSS